ncbi:MAG: RagB/SusD family nutrient uptake outer membrane protein [Bacteroidales bacterium]|nr:RagB/SusD family nutrient uptake outer membrane protein [Hoylesella loescheii]MCI6723317.1 RagB/SusD family nutrient uptake outer membrane protein [Bacteroidales bacterium]MDY3356280.1 RagB/SusD family nutrient uptake outer membrane protein [Prevotella sp.]MCI7560369.1 RagB/SusD family nutrient uptake outer membrane protein [Bacteroidales bacterium]MDD6028203.1 RagB/SusD family nutrient uptake outer membrane protein [Bacteroidales bacterium]
MAVASLSSCDSFLEEQIPQGTLSDEQVKNPAYVDNMVTSAYAVFTTAEDINSSFSMWNYDVRSDDAYKGGSSTNDGDVFHQIEVGQGILPTNWNLNDMWVRIYNALSRVNTAIAVVESCDESYSLKGERLAEMKFLRAYAHFMAKRLYKNIPFVMRTDLTYDEYNTLSNHEYTNDEGWALIARDLEEAYAVLPVKQADKGRPTKAACAAFLAKVYLYKAYRQDDASSNQVTSVDADDLKKVIQYTDPAIYAAGGYGLEKDIHNNFRPEDQYENGCESLWAIQYSRNDGSTYGNLNWSYGLITPNIPDVTDGGCDFYKPSQNLVNAFRTDADGLPLIDTFNQKNYDKATDNADPRLFLTVGMTGLPYMFNKDFIMDQSSAWSRSGGLYGYNVTLKQNVDPALIGSYLIRGSFWASPMNRIVFRYADVILERAEAEAQLGNASEAVRLVNEIRTRAAGSTQMIADYPNRYGVKLYCKNYTGSYSKDEALRIVKMERRLELAMESERFFDLVRWGEASKVLNDYFAAEKERVTFLSDAVFTANKNEYLPIPHSQISSSNGHYTQNIGNW